MSREQFEAWYLENWGHTEDDHETLFERDHDSDDEYYRLGVRMSHQAWQAATSAIEAKCAALAAENSELKATSDDRRMFIMNGVQLGYIKVPTVETDPALETIRVAVSPQEPTPVTDAFLAEVRAQGADAVADQHRRKYEELKPINVFFANEHMGAQEVAEFVAAQLRQDANTAELVAAGIITKVGE